MYVFEMTRKQKELAKALIRVTLGFLLIFLPYLQYQRVTIRTNGRRVFDNARASPSPCNNARNLKIAIFIAYVGFVEIQYADSYATVQCYANMHGYTLFSVNLEANDLIMNRCHNLTSVSLSF